MSVYRVVGRAAYREHAHGEIFEADLEPAAEQRAIARGDIALLESRRTQLRPGSYRLPDGWQVTETANLSGGPRNE